MLDSHFNKFSFDGEVTDEAVSNFYTAIKRSLESKKSYVANPSKLLSTVIELLDNAQRYSKGNTIEFDWFIKDDELVLQVSNVTDAFNFERMKKAISDIQTMTKQEVRESYNAILVDGQFNDHGGAGLGYLRIAKNGIKSINLQSQKLFDNSYVCTCNIVCEIRQQSN